MDCQRKSVSECTAINAVSAVSMKAAAACQTIQDLTGTHTSDPATWPDYGVKSLVRSPQCSLKPDDIADTMIENLRHNVGEQKKRLCSLKPRLPLKGSCVRWKVSRSFYFESVWLAVPTDGSIIYGPNWHAVMEKVNAEIARRVRSKNLGG